VYISPLNNKNPKDPNLEMIQIQNKRSKFRRKDPNPDDMIQIEKKVSKFRPNGAQAKSSNMNKIIT